MLLIDELNKKTEKFNIKFILESATFEKKSKTLSLCLVYKDGLFLSPEIINFVKSFENGTCESVTVQTAAEEKINISDMDDLESYKIDESICKMENDNSFFRRKDRNQNEELQDTLKKFNDKMKELIVKLPDENKNYYFKRAQTLKKKYTENFTAYLRHKALNPSWMVTGRSGLNVRKYENAMRKQDNLLQTLVDTSKNMNDLIAKAQKVISKLILSFYH